MAIEVSEKSADFDCQKCKWDNQCGHDVPGYPQSKGKSSFDIITIKRAGFVFDLKQCPLPMITTRTRYFFQLYADYKRGNLITGGGVNDQPNAYMQAMRILSAY